MKDISSLLQTLGLLESEIKTYETALHLGPSTVLDLTKKTKLSRQATYVAINRLVDLGIMSSVLVGKKRFFAAEHPEKLLAYAKRHSAELSERVKDLETMLPELALRMGGNRPIVRLFEGKEGLKAIIEDMRLADFNEIVEIADADALYHVLTQEDLAPLRAELKKRRVKVKGLYTGTPKENNVGADRIALPEKYKDFKADIGIYGDRIELITFEGKMYAVIIENKALAETLRILFELAFENAEKNNPPKKGDGA